MKPVSKGARFTKVKDWLTDILLCIFAARSNLESGDRAGDALNGFFSSKLNFLLKMINI